MLKLYLSVLLFFIMNLISNSFTIDDSIKQLIQYDTTTKDIKIFIITNLEVCISCNQSRLNNIFLKLKSNLVNSNINLVIESKNKNDADYLKTKFKVDSFSEDNKIFLTSKLNSPFILIYSWNNNYSYFKINNLLDVSKSNFYSYLNQNKNLFKREFIITENKNNFLSKVKIINDKSNLRIFDYSNKVFYNYDNNGKISDKLILNDSLMIFKGKLEYKDSIEKDGVIIDFDIKKVNFINDTLYVLFDRLLYDIQHTPENKYAIYIRTVIGKYYNKKLIDNRILDLRAYTNYFIWNNKNIVEYFIHPKLYKDTNIFLSEIDYNNNFEKNLWNLSLTSLNSIFNLNIKINNDIIFKDMDNAGNFVFMLKDTNKIYVLNDKSKFTLNLDGIIYFTDDATLLDWKISKNKFFLLLSDKRNVYIQSYIMDSGKLDKEIISGLENNEIISSIFFSITDNKIEFVNRWKNDRWVKDYIDIK